MKIQFTKMTGAGNDFVLVDNRDGRLRLRPDQIARLCDRHFGIGADGMLVAETDAKEDRIRMRYYNSDGGEASLCGNGARCFARFLQPLLPGSEGDPLIFLTGAGIVKASFLGEEVSISMPDPESARLRRLVTTRHGPLEVHWIHTGVPHLVVFVRDVERIDVEELGRELRWLPDFAPEGANADFVEVKGPDRIAVRTYERGVEGETLACGTGVTASALVAHLAKGLPSPVSVLVRSGESLRVGFERAGDGFRRVWLQGPATKVFTGEMEVSE
ncbi:diaminopimelate epimerase [Methylacidimicrobium cyclopophantes]|uniref:Diaminopimelate epimerase n=1 Tax=Methylacidimicrobium cyclopophantes TaxID=1041766 RepID=A0A5E6MEW1_9BACT|nr:diaminopimelate epimerase [Methylacidimicrobium cyclopophantes]VVM07775.1 diaminopimelate epimerase [Methylacidimicrobium cyclopophantes]